MFPFVHLSWKVWSILVVEVLRTQPGWIAVAVLLASVLSVAVPELLTLGIFGIRVDLPYLSEVGCHLVRYLRLRLRCVERSGIGSGSMILDPWMLCCGFDCPSPFGHP